PTPRDKSADLRQAQAISHPTQSSIRLANPLQEPDWDHWVLAHPDSNFFHSAAWAKVLHESYGYHPTYLVATEADSTGFRFIQPETPSPRLPVSASHRLLGLLPVMDVASPFT